MKKATYKGYDMYILDEPVASRKPRQVTVKVGGGVGGSRVCDEYSTSPDAPGHTYASSPLAF
jgi:hypothetical protein